MWICNKCKKENLDTVAVCSCGAQRMWVCATCETYNPFSVGICSICGAKRPEQQPVQMPKPAQAPSFQQTFQGNAGQIQQPVQTAPQFVQQPAATAVVTRSAPAAPAVPTVPAPAAPAAPVPKAAAAPAASADAAQALKKRKHLRIGLIAANVALLAVNVIGLIMIFQR